MSQFAALLWLKWTLFRNAMRSRKAVLSRVASMLGTLAALVFALFIAVVLGIVAYKMLSPNSAADVMAQLPPDHPLAAEMRELMQSGFLVLFMVFAILYLMWATVPLSLGGGSQFTPGRLLLYPVSLKKLFAIDFLSEFTNIASIFAIPVILSVTLGAGLALRNVLLALPVALLAIACGISIAKWLSTSLGALMQKRRTRGETLLALIGVVVGLGGAFMGELAQYMTRHAGSLRGLRWTPPGAAATALTEGLGAGGVYVYLLALLTLAGYTLTFIFITYLIARRAALSAGGAKRASVKTRVQGKTEIQTGWLLPFLSPQISAIIEKELRYAMRNAQLRVMALMPLVLIGVRLARGSRMGARSVARPETVASVNSFTAYAEGLLVAGGVLYVFLILSSLACNLFAYEGGGMRSYILAPIDRRKILLGKNLAITFLAFIFCAVLLTVNQLFVRDLTLQALVFAALSFLLFAACLALIGNLLSIRFPKRVQFGKRMNASGVTGFLLIPILLAMMVPPVIAAVVGYYAQSFALKYVTLALFAVIAIALYFLLITQQGRALARHEQEILEAVSGRTED
ncbi:MAG: type transport system permease protein [Acidobacteriota bacterium]|nr:type transport system permease protein [Acidobacteriota bacterium]